MAFPDGWGWKCSMTIAPAAVGADLTNFAVLLTQANCPSDMLDADGDHPALNGGGDVRFSSDSAGETRLPCEIVTFQTNNNPASAVVEMYVQVPSITAASGATFYMWWDASGETQPARAAQYGMEDTWDYTGAYSVLHLNEDPGTTAGGWVDSTANNHDGTGTGTSSSSPASSASGQIGNCALFDDSTDERIEMDSGILYESGWSAFSILMWLNSDDSSNELIAWYDSTTANGNGMGGECESHRWYEDDADEDGTFWTGTVYQNRADLQKAFSGIASGTWFYIADSVVDMSTSSPDVTCYENAQVPVTGSISDAFTTGGSYDNFSIGGPWGGSRTWSGYIDEVRIFSTEITEAWSDAVYSNTNNPAGFVTEGTPEATVNDLTGTHTVTDLTITKGTHAGYVDRIAAHSVEDLTVTAGTHAGYVDRVALHTVEDLTITAGTHASHIDLVAAHSVTSLTITAGTHTGVRDLIGSHSVNDLTITTGSHSGYVDRIANHSVVDLSITKGTHTGKIDVTASHTVTDLTVTTGTHTGIRDCIAAHNVTDLTITKGTHTGATGIVGAHSVADLSIAAGTHSGYIDRIGAHSVEDLTITKGTHSGTLGIIGSHTVSDLSITKGTHAGHIDLIGIQYLQGLDITKGTHYGVMDLIEQQALIQLSITAGTHVGRIGVSVQGGAYFYFFHESIKEE